jgi:hypothetical protein
MLYERTGSPVDRGPRFPSEWLHRPGTGQHPPDQSGNANAKLPPLVLATMYCFPSCMYVMSM